MKLIQIGLMVILVLISLAQVGAAKERATAPLDPEQLKGITPFTAVVQRNWKSWSQGNDTVAKLDLIARMASSEYKGEDAAALVALELYLAKNPPLDLKIAVTLDDPKIIDHYYRNVLKLQRAKRVLFANGQPTTFELLQQGPAGDCYFFSATGWMARNRPGDIMNAITQLGDGRFRVRFANGDEATVTMPTDAELAVNDSDSTLQDGIWMSVLEKATGTIQARIFSKSAAIPDPTVAIDTAGIPIASVVERWSGREAKKLPLGKRAHREQVRNALIRMSEKNHWQPPCCCTNRQPNCPTTTSMPLWTLTQTVIELPSGTPGEPTLPPTAHQARITAMPARNGSLRLPLISLLPSNSFLAIEQK